jgi:hypothetical protein
MKITKEMVTAGAHASRHAWYGWKHRKPMDFKISDDWMKASRACLKAALRKVGR